MTVYINGRFLTQPVSGVQRYARSILDALDGILAQQGGPAVEVLVPDRALADVPEWAALRLRRVRGGAGHVWDQMALFRASRDGVLVSLGNTGPVRHRRHVLALHDAHVYQMPGAFSRRYRAVHRVLRPRLARRAAALITVSQYSAGQLARYLGVSPDLFHVIPNAADHVLDWPADRTAPGRYGLSPGAYLLAVGNQSPNKNIGALVRAHGRCAGVPDLAVVGGAVPGVSSTACGGLRRLGRVPDADLRGLYDGAAGFVFPSLHEGFGIPPLEAMALGVPVLCANTAAMPDVLGDAPLWFDPRDQDSITGALQRFAQMSESEKDRMRRAGLRQADQYRWESSARALWAIVLRVQQGVTSDPLGQHFSGARDPVGFG